MEPLRAEPSTDCGQSPIRSTGSGRGGAKVARVRHRVRMMGEPQQIRALAARLRDDAERLRQLARRVGATREVAWRSRAAALFRDRVGERAKALRRSAGELEEAARLVDAHAHGVEVARAQVVRVAGLGADLARAAAGALPSAGDRR